MVLNDGGRLRRAPRLLYPIYGPRTPVFGVDPLDDQHLAGLIMWVPIGLLLMIAGLTLFSAWLGESERRVARSPLSALLHRRSVTAK